MHRNLATFAIVIGLCGLSARPAASRNLDACAAIQQSAERRECLGRAIGDRSVGGADLASIARLVGTRPESVVEIVSFLESRSAERGQVGPELLDLEGQALLALGRPAESADVFARALAVDDGSRRLNWFSSEFEERWVAELDAGDGRMIRAARGFLAAGRNEEALRWLDRGLSLGADAGPGEDWRELGEAVSSRVDRRPDPLTALDWFAPLPDVEIPLVDGSGFRLREAIGSVVLLNFWATWCEPCIRELGQLQYLYESERERGFEMIAVNAKEPLQLVVPYVKELGLTMPIGVYDEELHEAFKISRLPSALVADRLGRIRGRWTGYENGRENEVTDVVRLLLEQEPPSRPVGRIRSGTDLFEVKWWRDVRARISDVVLAPADDGPWIVAAQGDVLSVFRPDGTTQHRLDGTSVAGSLRLARANDDGTYNLFGFRAGGTGIVVFSMPDGGFETWDAPAPVFAIEPVDSDEGTVLLIGTLQGLYRADPRGTEIVPVEGFSLVSALSAGATGITVLETGGGLSWIDRSWNVLRGGKAGPESWSLTPGSRAEGGFGVASLGVTAMAEGRFIESDAGQVAAATRSGQLVVLDLASGGVRGRYEIPDITGLTAGDLDGDGLDELIVSSGSRLIVLSSAAVRPDGAGSD